MKKKALAMMLSIAMLMSSVVPGLLVSANETDPPKSTVTTIEGGETTDPTNPGEGGETTDPTNPGEGGETTDPSNPGEGGETTDPTNPGEGGETTDPTNPGEGGETTDPTNPVPPEIDTEAIYQRFMECKTLEEIEALLEQMTEEQLNALNEEQIAQIEAHINAMIPEGKPEIPLEPLEPSEPPVESEIISGAKTVDMTNVAPFLPPISGIAPMRAMAINGTGEPNNDTDAMKFTKTATWNSETNQADITLEAYATGKKTITSGKKDIPTDIVLVLDQSGSMVDPFERVTENTFVPYVGEGNSVLYQYRHNNNNYGGNLWHKLDDGSYVSVSVQRGDSKTESEYSVIESKTNSYYWEVKDRLYVKTEGGYEEVALTRTGDWLHYYTYTFPDGAQIESGFDWGNPNFQNKGPLYEQKPALDYRYVWINPGTSQEQEIETSTGRDTIPNTMFYEKVSNGSNMTRSQALRTALNNFVDSVKAKAAGPDGDIQKTDDNVNHRIAVVGFASGGIEYSNTEVLIGAEQYQYPKGAQSVYGRAFQNMDTQDGQNRVSASIGALEAKGATQADLGMEMAKDILDANSISSNEQRNRVVIFFTDGSPTSSNGFEEDVAQNAIQEAQEIKNLGVSVYSVGIFDGADATSSGNKNGNLEEKCNWFMQCVSSNDGSPKDPSYYLSASDSNTLNSIFEQISDNIESGGPSITLGAEAVIKDVISNQFQLPENNGKITFAVSKYVGENQWSQEEPANNVVGSISQNGKTVSVTGFDFASNYVGTETTDGNTIYRGQKLIIKFSVEPKPRFLGGNGVPTNDSAGIYQDSNATDPLFQIEKQPTVDVPILQPTVTAENKSVYLMQSPTVEELKKGMKVTLTDRDHQEFTLDFTTTNYGLEAWQTGFVTIGEVKLLDQDDTPVQPENLTEDTTYQLQVTILPKNEGAEEKKSGDGNIQIKVFKPEITWKDSQIELGSTPDYQKDNLAKVEWKHKAADGTVETADSTTMGEAPELTYTFSPAADLPNAFQQDTNVKVTEVRVNDTPLTKEQLKDCVTFLHENCSFPGCQWEAANKDGYHFIVHIKSFDLTITKQVKGEPVDPNQTFIFTVQGPHSFEMKVVIKGEGSKTIKGLPSGTYTITEDTNWSWRYTAEESKQKVTPQNGTAAVTFTNTLTNQNWLSGSSYVRNLFTGVQSAISQLLSVIK